MCGRRSRTAWSCWMARTRAVTAGVTNGLPSRSPPIQEPNVSTGRARGDLQAAGLGGSRELTDDVAGSPGRQVVEVEQGVAGLVGDLGLAQAELVGLPEQVDRLGDRAVGAVGAWLVEQLGDATQLDQD